MKKIAGWRASQKFRFQHRSLNKHLTAQETEIRARCDRQVKIYTQAEIDAFTKRRVK